MMSNQNYYRIKILTPVHVGGENEPLKENIDYITDGTNTYFLNWDQIIEDAAYSQDFNIDLESVLLTGRYDELKDEILKNKKKYTILSPNQVLNGDIRTHVKNNLTGNLILPGSSVKGAIRSVLLWFKYKNEHTKFNKIESQLKNVMKHIQIADVEFCISNSEFIKTKTFSLINHHQNLKGGWKHKRIFGTSRNFNENDFITTYEVLPVSSTQKFYCKIASKFKQYFKDTDGTFDLFKILNEYTKLFAEKEIGYYKKHDYAQYHEKLKSSWEKIKEKAEEAIVKGNKYAILRVGQGSGFHAVTGDWQFETHIITGIKKRNKRGKIINRGLIDNREAAKTRKWAFEQKGNDYVFYPMGFIAIGEVPEDFTLFDDKQRKSQKQSASPDQNTSRTEETKEPYKPEWKDFDKLKSGDVVDAEIIAPIDNLFKEVKLFVKGIENEIYKMRYAAPLENGTIVKVRITIMGRDTNRKIHEYVSFNEK